LLPAEVAARARIEEESGTSAPKKPAPRENVSALSIEVTSGGKSKGPRPVDDALD
jgi:hypothetical protein